MKQSESEEASECDKIFNRILRRFTRKPVVALNQHFQPDIESVVLSRELEVRRHGHGKSDKFPQNFYLISLLPAMSKIAQIMIAVRTQRHIEEFAILSEEQF